MCLCMLFRVTYVSFVHLLFVVYVVVHVGLLGLCLTGMDVSLYANFQSLVPFCWVNLGTRILLLFLPHVFFLRMTFV
jgi:hypothetical protein